MHRAEDDKRTTKGFFNKEIRLSTTQEDDNYIKLIFNSPAATIWKWDCGKVTEAERLIKTVGSREAGTVENLKGCEERGR